MTGVGLPRSRSSVYNAECQVLAGIRATLNHRVALGRMRHPRRCASAPRSSLSSLRPFVPTTLVNRPRKGADHGQRTPSPGWYQDPRDASQVRWWDGGQWTHNTQQMPGFASPMSQSPTAPEQAPTPGFEQSVAGDPWAAAGQAPGSPEAPRGSGSGAA